jgi:hypothetical protein
MENIKWSKKEVVVRHHLDRYGYPTYPRFDVNVYRWKNYRLEKELYGENRLFYHIAKDDRVRKLLTTTWENSEEQGIELYSIGETPLYLCDEHGSYSLCSITTIKEATRTLQYILENGLFARKEWVNPREEYVWNLLSYKPKRDVELAK